MSLASVEARVLDRLDLEGLVATLVELIEIRSDEGRESRAQLRMAELMADAGLTVDAWKIDLEALSRHPAYCAELDRDEALGVVGRTGAGRGRRLMLNGHVDVVPPGDPDRWSRSPWEGAIMDDRVFGRGAVDMKGGLCCALYAARAIRDAGLELAGELELASVVGEEDGGCGTLATLERGHRADGAVILEPTSLRIAPAQAGALNFRVRVAGRAAHASVRSEGHSAIDAFLPIYEALAEHERDYNAAHPDARMSRYPIAYPLSVGTLQAGDWASTVPEALVCEGRLGVAVDDDVNAARRQFEERVAAAGHGDPWLRKHPPGVEWWGGQFAPAAIRSDHELVEALAGAAAAATGETPAIEGVPYGSDLRLLVNEGDTPAVLFGPGHLAQAHAADEFVAIPQLEAAARSVALLALRFCGVA